MPRSVKINVKPATNASALGIARQPVARPHEPLGDEVAIVVVWGRGVVRAMGSAAAPAPAGASPRRPAATTAGLTLVATITPSWPRYAGTTGRTHGDRNETSPAIRAAP